MVNRRVLVSFRALPGIFPGIFVCTVAVFSLQKRASPRTSSPRRCGKGRRRQNRHILDDKIFRAARPAIKPESLNDWGGRACRKFVPGLGEDGSKIAPSGDIFDQPPGRMSSICGKLADHVGDHVVVFPEGADSETNQGTKSSYPRPPQSFNDSPIVSGCTRIEDCVASVSAFTLV